jgi:hypothetical protein
MGERDAGPAFQRHHGAADQLRMKCGPWRCIYLEKAWDLRASFLEFHATPQATQDQGGHNSIDSVASVTVLGLRDGEGELDETQSIG